MLSIRRDLFETNSSSVHALSVPYEPNTVEGILNNINPEVDEYLQKNGLIFGKSNKNNSDAVYHFQQKLNSIWNYLLSLKTPAFLRKWERLKKMMEDQPYMVSYDVVESEIKLSLDMRKQLIYFSGILDDKLRLFKFIFLDNSGFTAFDHLYWDSNQEKEREKADMYVLLD